MRPYFTVIVDSFREAIASWVLWLLLAALTIVLLFLAPIGLSEQRAVEFRGNGIFDPEGLARQIKEESQADGPSPGKRIWESSSDRFKKAVDDLKEDVTPDEWRRSFPVLIAELNKLLAKRDFYDEASWQGIALPQQANDLLDKGIDKLSTDDLRLLNRLLLRSAYRNQIARVPEVEISLSYFFFTSEPLPMSREMLEPVIENMLTAVMNYIVGLFAVFLAIVVTAAMIPRTFEAGSVDLLLSKPVSRSLLFLSKFLGGCAFILLNATYLIVGLWLIVGARLGIWNHNLLLCIPMLMFSFMIYYSVSALAGVLWKNAIVAVMATVMFRLAVAAVGFIKVDFVEEYFLEPNKIVSVAHTEDGIAAVNKSGQFVVWQHDTSNWESILQSQQPRGPMMMQPIVVGPVYDEKSRQLIFIEQPPFRGPQFRALGIRPTLVTGTLEEGWRRKVGPAPPSGASWMFLDDEGRLLVVASEGVFRIDAEARTSQGTNVLGVRVNLSLSDPYKRIGPDEESPHLETPFTAARNAQSGDLVVCSDKTLHYWKQDDDGQYSSGPTRKFNDLESPAMLAIAGQSVVMALPEGRILVLDAKTLKTTNEFQPVSSDPYAAAGASNRWIAILFHNERLWLYDTKEKSGSFLDNDVSAVAADASGHLLVADQRSRVVRYDPQSRQAVERYEPPMTAFLGFYHYVLVPVYTVFPKPGELGEVVEYLLTGNETPAPTFFFFSLPTEDLRQQRRKIDVYTPIWSSSLFIVVMLGITCIYLQRTDM